MEPDESDCRDTRRVIDLLEDWLGRFTAQVPVPIIMRQGGVVRYEYPERSSRILMVAKAVRIASAARAAMALADIGLIAETGALLRVIDDFAKEMVFIAEGEFSGKPTAAQKQFLDDFFLPPPASAKEFAEQEKKRWVSRDELYKAFKRLAKGEDGDQLVREGKFLDARKNAYIHGAYHEIMDLYDPSTRRFAVSRSPSARHTQVTKQAVALQVHFALSGYWFLAILLGLEDVAEEIRAAQERLQRSPEYAGNAS